MNKNPDLLLKNATRAGKLLLESGAEIYRVEETICRICENYKVEEASSIVMPTGIFVTIENEGSSYSKVVRVKSRSLNIDVIDQINALSRAISRESLTLKELTARLDEIEKRPLYSVKTNIFFACLVAFGFTLFFQGSWKDALVAFPLGGLIRGITLVLDKRGINNFINVCLCSGLAALLTLIAVHLHLADNKDAVIIGTIMLLVPGLAITNAIRDSIAGDFLSGLARGIEAFLIAIAVALGPGLVMSLWLRFFGGF